MTSTIKTRFSINLKDGRIVFRNPEVDEQVIYHPIPNEVAIMLSQGKVSPKKVIEACEKKIKEKGELTLQEYLKKLEKLNMRTKKDVKPPESNADVPDSRADEMITLEDLGIGKSKKTSSSESKEETPPTNNEEVPNIDLLKKSKSKTEAKSDVLNF